ncbi:hypothetical protein K3U93_05615 [Mycobacterium malmoense]|uniref:Uncharacterized protein n=1 Tax=Mycobacterium malmoense TaxID=1780 RepID=A0ABX3SK12_MYCMA|nr:hypothetical protein [Mycobacterium malmoense]ORA77027.1 hypothetical protein BST29_24195 [Mycobacterium malmoense]QZA18666.1 hypothetical protein K3U93_05615 [Mycobacterium malmoense]UNB95439.1 hypothetical protein H5T25_05610 [Mycobacterium malmoense]
MLADCKAPYAISSYLRGARYYHTWCAAEPNKHPFTRPGLQHWTTYILGSGAEPASARIRPQAVRRSLPGWPTKKKSTRTPSLGLKPRKIDTKVVERLADAELRLMLKPAPLTRPHGE